MIKVDGYIIEQNKFPDNSLLVKTKSLRGAGDGIISIVWNYENDAELFTLICLRKHYSKSKAILWMPYCPHARMDRVKSSNDVFTLKYFAEVINSLNFERVNILDPHSSVCTALIDNVRVIEPTGYIMEVLKKIPYEDLLLFYPDEGSMKRRSDFMLFPYAFGIKKRDWETGQIQGIDVMNAELVKDKTILIIDDICSKGGTFYHSAKKLKELGVKEIYLYVSHCENTILEGELLASGLIEKVYTTDSIFTKEHEKIEVIK